MLREAEAGHASTDLDLPPTFCEVNNAGCGSDSSGRQTHLKTDHSSSNWKVGVDEASSDAVIRSDSDLRLSRMQELETVTRGK